MFEIVETSVLLYACSITQTPWIRIIFHNLSAAQVVNFSALMTPEGLIRIQKSPPSISVLYQIISSYRFYSLIYFTLPQCEGISGFMGLSLD
jgi:hypothetical protein